MSFVIHGLGTAHPPDSLSPDDGLRLARFLAGRSTFHVLLRLPAGREPTREVVERLYEWSRDRRAAKPPELPRGTQLALARRMALVDRRGQLAPTPLTETVQLRVLHAPEKINGAQTYLEFRLRRRDLLAGKSGLSPVQDN